MLVRLRFEKSIARLLLVFCVGLSGGLLASLALLHFTASVLADPGLGVPREVLEGAAGYFPNDPNLHARLAANLVEAKVEENQQHDQVAARAFGYASRATRLAPYRYDNYVLLAVAAEMRGDVPSAEAALRRAMSLAPVRSSVRWRLGNLLLRQGNLTEAVAELRAVVAADNTYLPESLSLLWQAANDETNAERNRRNDLLQQVTGVSVKNQLVLAQFLVGQEQYESAAQIYDGLDAKSLRELQEQPPAGAVPRPGETLDKLLAAGRTTLAARLWQKLLDQNGHWGTGQVWNGGFETLAPAGLTQFDWSLSNTSRTHVEVTTENPHTGRRALKLTYLDKETTRLETEIRQLLVVQPGKKYKVECYVKTIGLVTPDGPQMAVVQAVDHNVLVVTAPVTSGTRDWQPLQAVFTAPANVESVLLTIRQTPKFSYTEPTRGAVWFDDFRLIEQSD